MTKRKRVFHSALVGISMRRAVTRGRRAVLEILERRDFMASDLGETLSHIPYSFPAQATDGLMQPVAVGDILAAEATARSSIEGSIATNARPNIIVINTDDIRVEQTQYMPFLSKLSTTGTVFNNSISPTSVSGPSRASLLTGLLAVHHGVLSNSPSLGTNLNFDDSNTLPVNLSAVGYTTGLFGKDRTQPNVEAAFSNENILQPAPGWDRYFAGLEGPVTGYNATFTNDGVLYQTPSGVHVTDVIMSEAKQFLDSTDGPFFAYIATYAPHSPGIPAARHEHLYDSLQSPRNPNYNIPEPGFAPLSAKELEQADEYYRRGTESLLAVDEGLAQICALLNSKGELDNTVIIFTGDNGYSYGEHGIVSKNVFFEESIRVPLMIWDGRNRVGAETNRLATTVDVAATILDLAGVQKIESIDGQSLMPIAEDPYVSVRDDVLLYHRNSSRLDVGVRTERWVYNESSVRLTYLYDLQQDPFEVENLARSVSHQPILEKLRSRLQELLPDDKSAPELTRYSFSASTGPMEQLQTLRLIATVDDRSSGGSGVRTPAMDFTSGTPFALSSPMQALDGTFDSAVETTFYDFLPEELVEHSWAPSVQIRTRDTVGNIGTPVSITLPWRPAAKLRPEAIPGSLLDQPVTLGLAHTFVGTGLPGEQTALFAISKARVPLYLGTTVVNAEGTWKLDVTFPAAGEYVITGQIASPSSMSVELFLRPSPFHILAEATKSEIIVRGSEDDDVILVDSSDARWVDISLNGSLIGQLPTRPHAIIIGAAGNDQLEIRGPIPGRLDGGRGDDVLLGGDGSDELDGGVGANLMRGRRGNDTYKFNFSDQDFRSDLNSDNRLDRVDENDGEGNDTIQLLGPFTTNAYLTADQTDPLIEIQPRNGKPRRIQISDVSSIEKILNNALNGHWLLPTSLTLLSTESNQVIQYGPSVAVNEQISLGSLGSYNQSTATAQLSLTLSGGIFQLIQPLPSQVVVVLQTETRLVLRGPGALIDQLLFANKIVASSNEESTPRMRIIANRSIIGSSSGGQRKIITVPIANQGQLSGSVNTVFAENGDPVFPVQNPQLTTTTKDWVGAKLVIGYANIRDPHDQLSIVSSSSGIKVVGDRLVYKGVAIGSIVSSGKDGKTLAIRFTQHATVNEIESVLNQLTFMNNSDSPADDLRKIQAVLIDRYGGVASLKSNVRVVSVNDAPAFRELVQPTLVYDRMLGRPVALGSGIAIEDPDGGWGGSSLTVQFKGFYEATDKLYFSSDANGFAQVSIRDGTIYFNNLPRGTFTSISDGLKITWRPEVGAKEINTLLSRLKYLSTSDSPALESRIIQFGFVDSAGLSAIPLRRTIKMKL